VAKRKGQAPHCADTKAVSGVSGFAGLPKCVLKSESYRSLSLVARAILVEIVARFDGHNNGCIHASYAELAHRLNRKNQAPIGPAIAELMQHGLLDLSAESVWRERRAREYRLPFVNTSDSIGRTIKATNDYLGWRAKNDATDAVAAKPKSATPFVAGKIAAATDAVATANGKPPKTLEGSATDGVPLIVKPYAGPQTGDSRSSDLDPLIVDGPISGGPLQADLTDIRGRISSYFYALSPKRRRVWAAEHGVTAQDVQRYCVGDPQYLPPPKIAAMVLAIRNEKAQLRATRAAKG
jgi:hypothetical protein